MIYLSKLFNKKNDAKAIYGIILIQALLSNYNYKNISSLDIAIKTFLGALIIVIAEIYSEILGSAIKKSGDINSREIKKISRESLVILLVSINPTIIFLLSHFSLFTTKFAFIFSYTIGLFELFIFGYLASFSITNNKFKSLRLALISTFIGFIIIFAKNYFSH